MTEAEKILGKEKKKRKKGKPEERFLEDIFV